VKTEYFAPSCCLARDLLSHVARVEILAFSTAGSSRFGPQTRNFSRNGLQGAWRLAALKSSQKAIQHFAPHNNANQ
jgi:hypothetical protein